jgi:glycerol-3-phosphate dehydrogenase
MAKMAVDRLVEREARDAPCRTHEIPLGQAIDERELPRVEGVPERAYAQLAGRYGHAAHDVLKIASERGELAQPVVDSGPADLLAEVVFATRREQARGVGDALLRRTRLGLLAAREVADPSGTAARRVAQAMAADLGWDERRVEAEASAFLDEAAAEGIVAGGS